MNPGVMNDRVRFLKPSVNETSYASSEAVYKLAFETFARVKPLSGNRALEAGRIVNNNTIQIRIRYYHKVDYNMIIEYDGLSYRIISKLKERDLNCITIVAEEINE